MQIVGNAADNVFPPLLTTVSLGLGDALSRIHTGEIVLDMLGEESVDASREGGLIVLDRQHVIGLGLHDGACDFYLATHGVDRHQTA